MTSDEQVALLIGLMVLVVLVVLYDFGGWPW